jgi:pimeloyl-ACP methyl ester carboxylesterase
MELHCDVHEGDGPFLLLVHGSLYHPDAYVAAFETLRERLGASRWLVCGQSLGATLTLRYALDHPERVRATA